jgi:citrate lyase subunit beta/citryl-CoA lyase
MRSKLFVPASRVELFAKALAGPADAISVDLEDAVAEERKAEARSAAGEFLRSAALAQSGKLAIVRVNPQGGAHFDADLRAVVCTGLAFVNLPKCESADAVRAAALAIERAAAANDVREHIGILANIETPAGLRAAAAIAGAHPAVSGLQIGYLDLFEPLGAERRDPSNVHAVMFAVRLAAGEAGVFAYDGAWPDFRDEAGFRAEAAMARRLGFLGKSCIHPSQVAIANEVFTASDAELAAARRIVAAKHCSQGAFELDGRMVDAPTMRRAASLLAAHPDRA